MSEAAGDLVCVVEMPKGTRNKYEYDPELGGIKFDRLLMSAATYPTDYGYLRGTMGLDGDPLHALVCLYEPTFYEELDELPLLLRQEIEQFFSIYKDLEEGKHVEIDGWHPRADAVAEIEAARERLRAGG
jgi:inorganic pyrophosphatase